MHRSMKLVRFLDYGFCSFIFLFFITHGCFHYGFFGLLIVKGLLLFWVVRVLTFCPLKRISNFSSERHFLSIVKLSSKTLSNSF